MEALTYTGNRVKAVSWDIVLLSLGSLLFQSNGGKAEATHGVHHHHSQLNRDDVIHLYKEATFAEKPWLG